MPLSDDVNVVEDAHVDALSQKSGNKPGNSGQKDGGSTPAPPTNPDGAYISLGAPVLIVITIQNVGTEAFNDVFIRLPGAAPFDASGIVCSSTTLAVGATITCQAPVFNNQNDGQQYINVMASATAVCTEDVEEVTAQGKWYTPVSVTPPPKPPAAGSSSSSGEGKSGDKANGCDVAYWTTAPSSAYPSYWTPSTPFYIAAGLSKDPLSGQTLSDVFMSSGDGLNAFYRASAAALLNAATISKFGLSKWEVQSRIESALSRYFRSGMTDTTSIDLWRKQFLAWSSLAC